MESYKIREFLRNFPKFLSDRVFALWILQIEICKNVNEKEISKNVIR